MPQPDAQERFLRHFLTHRDSVAAFIRVLMRDASAVDDILQEVSLVLWRKFDQFREGTSFGAWARRIALNEVLKARQRLARAPLPFGPETLAAMNEAFDELERMGTDDELKSALRRCLDRLTPAARSLVDLRYFENLKLQDVAAKLGRSTAGANSTLCKARQFLESCIRQTMRRRATHEGA